MKVLMCTGGSKFAERAMDSTGILMDKDDDITIFHVKEEGVSPETLEVCRKILKNRGIDAKTKSCENKLGVAKEILKEARSNYDLIVMGSLGMSSHGHGSFHRFLLGMNAFRVIENAETSVLIVRGAHPPNRVLMGVSGSVHDYEIVNFACALFDNHISKIKFLHVIPEISEHFKVFMPPQIRASMKLLEEEEFERSEHKYLDKCVEIAKKCDIPEIKTKLREGDPAAQILNEAEEGGYDLIAVGARKSEKFPLGNAAHRIVNHARCSFLVVRRG
ncbi:MAG: hypothetical protein A7315_14740 [Candidatus Altiarchaeales archaeon WOR_SM1_79]|nr:MAG: hypothetical protein A7315_14740 [Candidatus Altiarchaeales archaeon WOR_SM1_79]